MFFARRIAKKKEKKSLDGITAKGFQKKQGSENQTSAFGVSSFGASSLTSWQAQQE